MNPIDNLSENFIKMRKTNEIIIKNYLDSKHTKKVVVKKRGEERWMGRTSRLSHYSDL